MPEPKTPPAPSTPVQPTTTPPDGGRWTWDGAQWVRLAEEATEDQPAADAATTKE